MLESECRSARLDPHSHRDHFCFVGKRPSQRKFYKSSNVIPEATKAGDYAPHIVVPLRRQYHEACAPRATQDHDGKASLGGRSTELGLTERQLAALIERGRGCSVNGYELRLKKL
jgi:hypothetical protein